MEFIVDNKVLDLGLKIKAVVINGIDNKNISDDYLLWRGAKVKEMLKKYENYDLKADDIIEGFYLLHEKVDVKRRKNLPASENLIKILTKKGGLANINKVVDIYNLISIDTKLCLGAHDIDKISGNVYLKITDGTETFLPLGLDEKTFVNAGEYSFVDGDNEVICHLDIRQVDKTKVEEKSTNILYLIIGNENTTDEYLENCADDLVKVTTKYCGGNAQIIRWI